MTNDLSLVAALFGPLFMGLVFHGFCIKFGWLRSLVVPIDRGIRLRGRPLFGANKTYRGVVAVALGSAAGYGLQSLAPSLQPPSFRDLGMPASSLLGLAIGAAAMVSELLNSFIKRRVDVPPGEAGGGPAAVLFYVFDQVDFLLGAWLVVAHWTQPTLSRIAWSVLFVVVVHQVISGAGALLGMRASAR